jgi:hypothetical protein
MTAMNRFLPAVSLSLVLAASSPGEPTEIRVWTSKSSQQLKARGIRVNGNTLVLEREDGSNASIAIRRLIKEDQDYVVRHFQLDTSDRDVGVSPAKKVELPWPSGKITAEIKTEKATQWSYRLYLPKSFHMEREWPVLFVMSPGGGSADVLQRYIEGAEFNGWILALSVQSRNGFDGSEEAILAMVEDVTGKMPVDERRMYSSGFSGGARMAFWLAGKLHRKRFAGVLACGAGAIRADLSDSTVVYGLCGSNCFNRWDMACTHEKLRNRDNRLRFFVGGHAWAGADLIQDGMTWLNCCYLRKAASTNRILAAEGDELTQRICARIEADMNTNRERAYEWARVLAGYQCRIDTKRRVAECLAMLQADEGVKLYTRGLDDVDRFVQRHFATDVMDYRNNNGTPEAARDGTRYAEQYGQTKLAELFRKMGQPAVSP